MPFCFYILHNGIMGVDIICMIAIPSICWGFFTTQQSILGNVTHVLEKMGTWCYWTSVLIWSSQSAWIRELFKIFPFPLFLSNFCLLVVSDFESRISDFKLLLFNLSFHIILFGLALCILVDLLENVSLYFSWHFYSAVV